MAKAGGVSGRLLRLITLIQGDRRWRPMALAAELDVEVRTIHRDIQRLQDAGIPVTFDRAAGGYIFRRGFFLPPLDLTPEEACALLLLSDRVGGARQLPLTRPASSAMQKLRAALPRLLRDDLGDLLEQVSFRLAAAEGEGIEDAWSIVSRAIAERTTLRCEYEPAGADTDLPPREPFDLDPYELHFNQRAWYVIGHHHGRDACRTLRLSRFAPIVPTDRHFDRPADFSLDDHFGQAWRMIPGDRVRRHVTLRFTKDVADTVSETWWHPTQRIEHHDDGSLTARFEIDGLDEIVYWILGYGPHCEVVEPPELRRRVVELIRASSRLYGNDKVTENGKT